MRYTVNAFEFKYRNLYIGEHFNNGKKFEVTVAHTGFALDDPDGKTVSVTFCGYIPPEVDHDTLMYWIINILIDDEKYLLDVGRVKEERMGHKWYRIRHEFKVHRRQNNED